ncbi:hypothetical protein RND71_042437 [Anisodus tanguticus]|uniref:PMI1/PMIR1-2 C-terminal domain-containing protein n=1 Tax=Anisodus tanguticus TaxID=243964 RepID=A0AAE1QQY4_9SOLA|nr:hypothetical protein RND71_042437 [Anisodus tanguticus]
MWVSSPVVVPAEIGSGIMDILQHLDSIGIEKLSIQANKLMPLEDITGQTMRHIGWKTTPSLDRTVRPKSSNSVGAERKSEYISLEDLARLAMDKIESLSIKGLRI